MLKSVSYEQLVAFRDAQMKSIRSGFQIGDEIIYFPVSTQSTMSYPIIGHILDISKDGPSNRFEISLPLSRGKLVEEVVMLDVVKSKDYYAMIA